MDRLEQAIRVRAEDYPGTGVGLVIVRKAMQRMGIDKPVNFESFIEVAAQIELYWCLLNHPPK